MNLNSKAKTDEFLSKFDTILYDFDQILWPIDKNNNENPINDLPKLLNNLRKRGKNIVLISNTCDQTREQLLIKLKKLGFEATIDELFPTSYTTAVYLKAINFERKVLVIGSDAIAQELDRVGIRSTDQSSLYSTPKELSSPGFATFKLNPEVGAVVVGFDDNPIPFPSLVKACSYATKPDILFIAANSPELTESAQGLQTAQLAPAIQVVCNKGFISFGKLHKFYFNCIRRMNSKIDSNRTVIIADRLTSDIIFGKNNGIKTLFVDSSVGSRDESFELNFDTRPDYCVDSLATFSKYI